MESADDWARFFQADADHGARAAVEEQRRGGEGEPGLQNARRIQRPVPPATLSRPLAARSLKHAMNIHELTFYSLSAFWRGF